MTPAAGAWGRALTLGEPAPPAEPLGSPERAPGAPLSAHAALGLARVALVRGDAEDAVVRLEAATAAAPGFGPAFRLLADAYATLDRNEDAARALRTADRLPLYEPYLDRLAEALIRESRSTTFLLQQAATVDLTTNSAWREHLIRRALEFDPNHRVALAELATMYRVLRRYDEALEVLERQRRLRPDDAAVLADIGRCLSGLGRYTEAEPMLRRAIEGLDNALTRYALGLVLDRTGRRGEATAEYRRALDHNPNHLGALNNLGVALATQGRMDEATRHFERLVAVDPDDADAHSSASSPSIPTTPTPTPTSGSPSRRPGPPVARRAPFATRCASTRTRRRTGRAERHRRPLTSPFPAATVGLLSFSADGAVATRPARED